MYRKKDKKIKEYFKKHFESIGIDYADSAAFMAYGALKENGYECYFVGGCVRDALLDRACHDIDLCTNARPEELMGLDCGDCLKAAPTGIKHGTVTLASYDRETGKSDPSNSVEVTTYRADEKGEFSDSLEEDLHNRDFTINALAYDWDAEEVLAINEFDFNDIERRRIDAVRCSSTFMADPLRMLRAIRFKAQLGFSLGGSTGPEILQNSRLMMQVSPERIREELEKILMSERPEALSDICGHLGSPWMKHPPLSAYIFDAADGTDVLKAMEECGQDHPRHYASVLKHTIDAVKNIDKSAPNARMLAWAALFHDAGKPFVKTRENGRDRFIGHAKKSAELWKAFAERYRFDNDAADGVYKLILHHDDQLDSQKAVRKMISKLGPDLTKTLFDLKEADAKAHKDPEGLVMAVDRARKDFEAIMENGQATSLEMLAVNGNDLIDAGFAPGKELGALLRTLLEIVLAYPEMNDKGALLDLAATRSAEELQEEFPLADFQ